MLVVRSDKTPSGIGRPLRVVLTASLVCRACWHCTHSLMSLWIFSPFAQKEASLIRRRTAGDRPFSVWLVLLAAGGTFALTMGVRQTMGLFLSALNTSTALGIGNISLAFAFGQLWWGLTQPFAGAVADLIGT